MFAKFFPLCALLFSTSAIAADPTVGIVIPLTGGASSYGKACLNGIALAREDLATMLAGKVSFTIEDDQNAPANTVSALRSIQQRTKAKIFLTWASNTSKAVNQIAERENFLQFAVATDPAVAQGKRNVFRYWVSAETEVKKLLAGLKQRRIDKIAIVTAQQDGLLSVKKALLQLAPSAGIQVLYDEEFPTDQRDFRTHLTKIRGLPGLDGVFNNLYVGQSGLFARQARDLGLHHPLFAVELYEDQAVLDAANGALDGQFYINASDGTTEFVTRYRKRFPGDTLTSAANCYDFVSLLAHSPEVTVDGFRKYLFELTEFPGMVGTVSSNRDQSFDLPAVLKIIKGRDFVTLPE